MGDEPSLAAGKRFSDDLRRIREERGVSLDEIHKETQIARTLLDSFEEGALYDHPTYNRVYLRSFIKAYSHVIGVPQEEALGGLESVLEGTYEHELADEYLNVPDPDDASFASTEPSDASEDEGPEGDEAETEEEDSAPASSGSPRSSPDGPTAGGPDGRGGIVGPPRAVGEEPDPEDIPLEDEGGESPTEESSPDEHSSSLEGAAEGEDVASTEDRAGQKEEASGGEDGPHDPDDFPSDSGENEEESGLHEKPDMTGPEALRSSPDEEGTEADSGEQADAVETDTERDAPAWMEEAPEEDRAAESTPASASGEEPPSLEDTGETGIVGEPSAVGDGGQGAPGTAGASAAPTGESPARRSSSDGFFSSANQQVYVTGIGIAVVFLVLLGVGIAYFSSEGEESTASTPSSNTTTTTTEAQPDTATTSPAADTASAGNEEEEAKRPPPADVSLGRTIHLMVFAEDNVSDIRIQRDDDLRRPYWIEEGEASVFPFERRIIIVNELSDVRLYVEGYPYPRSEDTTRFEVTRQDLETFVDTLRGTRPSLSVSPDTIPVGEPPSVDESEQTPSDTLN